MWKTTRLHSTQKSSEQPQTRNIDIIKKDPTPRENHHPTPQGGGRGTILTGEGGNEVQMQPSDGISIFH